MAKKKGKVKEDPPEDDDDEAELNHHLSLIGLRVVSIKGDGNCMFRSLSHQMFGHENEHKSIRNKICNHIQDNVELYKDFVQETFDRYLDRMRNNGVHGTNVELVAASRALGVDIHIHQLHQPPWLISTGSKSGNSNDLHIVFHANLEHYDSLCNINGPSTGPPLVKISKPADEDIIPKRKKDPDAITAMEKIVLNSTNLTIANMPQIRRLLEKYRGNVNLVVDDILENGADSVEPTLNTDDLATTETQIAKNQKESISSTQVVQNQKAKRKEKILANREKRKNKGATAKSKNKPPPPDLETNQLDNLLLQDGIKSLRI